MRLIHSVEISYLFNTVSFHYKNPNKVVVVWRELKISGKKTHHLKPPFKM